MRPGILAWALSCPSKRRTILFHAAPLKKTFEAYLVTRRGDIFHLTGGSMHVPAGANMSLLTRGIELYRVIVHWI
jgi:hypothetical protein